MMPPLDTNNLKLQQSGKVKSNRIARHNKQQNPLLPIASNMAYARQVGICRPLHMQTIRVPTFPVACTYSHLNAVVHPLVLSLVHAYCTVYHSLLASALALCFT